MKNVLLLLACALALSCSKKITTVTHYTAAGSIRGIDRSNCVCCYGYVLHINNDVNEYHFNYFPQGTLFDTTHFPINVDFSDTLSYKCGPISFITLTTVKKAD
jgi:hypothetical protein